MYLLYVVFNTHRLEQRAERDNCSSPWTNEVQQLLLSQAVDEIHEIAIDEALGKCTIIIANND